MSHMFTRFTLTVIITFHNISGHLAPSSTYRGVYLFDVILYGVNIHIQSTVYVQLAMAETTTKHTNDHSNGVKIRTGKLSSSVFQTVPTELW